jgi:alginate O-acetyltransferase complex protein AlgI
MLFTEPRFFILFAVVFSLYWAAKNHMARKLILLVSSYVFYGAWDWRFLFLIFFTTTLDFFLGKAMEDAPDQGRKKRFLLVSLISNLGVLAFFKYTNFFIDSAETLAANLGFAMNKVTLHIVLPVGISFYTFQSLSYSIDIYRGELKAERNWINLATFVAFFPQLVAGPIVRAVDFLPQLREPRTWQDVAVKTSLLLFAIGFFKKACVSDNIAFYADAVFDNVTDYTSLSAFIGVCLYAAQIYCDFSGYSDMAMGLAGLLGFKLMLNFRSPYIADSIIHFWHRWHISLSTWLRDYLYIPLGGNRYGALMRYRNLFITMLLGGLWHGANWTFVIWGALHGVALAANHAWRDYVAPKVGFTIPVFIGWIGTLSLVLLGWVFFRAPDAGAAFDVLGQVFGNHAGKDLPLLVLILPALLLAVHFLWRRYDVFLRIETLSPLAFTVVLALLAQLCLCLIPQGYQPFIYFQF